MREYQTSHVTRHTSHVTRHTSHVTRHLGVVFDLDALNYSKRVAPLVLQGTLTLNTPFRVAGGLGVGQPVVLYDAGTGLVDFGTVPEQFTTGAVDTLTASRNVSNADLGETLYYTGAGNITLTIPAGLVPGWWCRVVQGGAGKVTLAGSGVTVSGKQGQLSTGGQWHVIEVRRLTASQYVVHGDTAN